MKEKTAVQRLAGALRLLVWLVFIVNLLCLPLAPGFVALSLNGGREAMLYELKTEMMEYAVHTLGHVLMFFATCLWAIWPNARYAALTIFFWLCGTCTALILWQAKETLDTILDGDPFRRSNARSLNRAAVCCWVISGAALTRLIVWLTAERSVAPLFTYNALAVPAFLMAGLLFQVMSALFRQAAELKEDQDLTI